MKIIKKNTILFSKPLTCHAEVIPDNFKLVCDEAEISFKYKNKAGREVGKIINEKIKKNKFIEKVVLVSGRYSEKYIFNNYLFGINNYVPNILMDIEWHWRYRKKFTIKNVLNKTFHKILCRGCNTVSVFCEVERYRYSDAFDVPIEKFMWIPYCSNLDELPGIDKNKQYLFTGGLHDRDYKTLFQAVKGTKIPIKIAAPYKIFENIHVPDNVELLGVLSKGDYFKQMNGSMGVVLSLDTESPSSSLRCPGVITYVAAMRMRKCVIVNEKLGASSYIENNKHGLLVDPHDHVLLKEALCKIYEDYIFRDEIANNAYTHAHSKFGYERYFKDINSAAEKL